MSQSEPERIVLYGFTIRIIFLPDKLRPVLPHSLQYCGNKSHNLRYGIDNEINTETIFY